LHNAIDINIYFGSLGVVGAVTVGLLFSGTSIGRFSPARGLIAGAVVLSSTVIGFGALVFTTDELRHRAQIEYESNKILVAIETLEQARAVMPWNSSVYHESGEILLDASQKFHDTKYLDRAIESFRRAIELSPNKVGPHIGLGLGLSQAGNLAGALSELDIAHDLYPRSTYVKAIARLLEQQKGMIRGQ
jgi:tetratricopeptide (TPR) repeat protein